MIDATTGPLITHQRAVLSFMSQQLQKYNWLTVRHFIARSRDLAAKSSEW